MLERDYSRRDIVAKLGIRPGYAVAFDERAWALDPGLRARVLERAGRSEAVAGEAIDVALIAVDARSDVVGLLRHWARSLHQAGGIWLLSPKRGRPGYVDQRDLIAAGQAAGLADNKICSVSEAVSGMRFVTRKRDRGDPLLAC